MGVLDATLSTSFLSCSLVDALPTALPMDGAAWGFATRSDCCLLLTLVKADSPTQHCRRWKYASLFVSSARLASQQAGVDFGHS